MTQIPTLIHKSKMTLYLKLLIILLVIVSSCSTQKNASETKKVNTKINGKYKKSVKKFNGQLSRVEYLKLKNDIEKELNVEIPKDKSILINYNQGASNCFLAGYKQQDFSDIINNVINISNRMSKEFGAVDFFIYSENAFNKEVFESKKVYRLDSGFFYNSIFTLHENCEAFLILKPNGDFLKCYGEDYFTGVENFLKEM